MSKKEKSKEEKKTEWKEEFDNWWAGFVADANIYIEGKVAVGCAKNPNKPLTSKRRYVDY
jgi:hypothetical protein